MKKRYSWKWMLPAQLGVVGLLGLSLFNADANTKVMFRQLENKGDAFTPVAVHREHPHQLKRPYDRPDWISDEDLAMVLDKVQPRFERKRMKPNFVEHALRTWGVTAEFQNPKVVSGQEMLSFLTDNASFVTSWGKEIAPILQERPQGVGIRWGTELCASFHHDHLLACVTEGGAPLNTPVYGPTRTKDTLYNVLQEALRDFRLDEREIEWTAMAFGMWIAPEKEWIGNGGRQYSFDLIVHRLLRGEKALGVCAGTHRVYSLLTLILLDDEFDILSDDARALAYEYLEQTRDAILDSQFEDGHWASDWPRGKFSVSDPVSEPEYRAVIATGHHLEWMSLAPKELQIPEDRIQKAVNWIVENTREKTREEIHEKYTFYSHVGAALANWRQTTPAKFWKEWETKHPFDPATDPVETPKNDAAEVPMSEAVGKEKEDAAATEQPAEKAPVIDEAKPTTEIAN